MSELKKNLYERMLEISTEVKGIEKDMDVGTGNNSYKAVSDKSVVLTIKEAERKHGVISIPFKQELIKTEIIQSAPDQNGRVKLTYVDIIKMTTKFVNIDDPTDSIEVESFGRGVDTSDKGFGKAATYARKYALLNAYKIATGVDPDAEASKPMEQAEQVDVVRLKVINYLLMNDEYRENIFQHFNKGSLDELTASDIATIHNNLKKKNLL